MNFVYCIIALLFAISATAMETNHDESLKIISFGSNCLDSGYVEKFGFEFSVNKVISLRQIDNFNVLLVCDTNHQQIKNIVTENLGRKARAYLLFVDDVNDEEMWYDIFTILRKTRFSAFDGYRNQKQKQIVQKNAPAPGSHQSTSAGGCIGISGKVNIVNDNTMRTIYIDEIMVGDMVETSVGLSEVYFVYDHDDMQNVLTLRTDNNFVSVTPNHIIQITRNDIVEFVTAASVIVGDYVMEESEWVKITSIENNSEIVRYVLTTADDIIVNDIVVSCHVDNHNLGKHLTMPLRWVHNVCPSCIDQDTLVIEGLKSIYQTFVY